MGQTELGSLSEPPVQWYVRQAKRALPGSVHVRCVPDWSVLTQQGLQVVRGAASEGFLGKESRSSA